MPGKFVHTASKPLSLALWPAKKLVDQLGAVKVTVHLGAYMAYTPKTVPHLHSVSMCIALDHILPVKLVQVTLVGTWPGLEHLPRDISKGRRQVRHDPLGSAVDCDANPTCTLNRAQLKRVKSFLKIETAKQYWDAQGKARCVKISASVQGCCFQFVSAV